jgi:hypothetical protein
MVDPELRIPVELRVERDQATSREDR